MCVVLGAMAERLAERFWPGPLTLVLPRRADCAISLLCSAGLDSLAVRVPGHPVAQSLLRRFGSLISTIAAMPFTREQIEMHVDVLLPRCCAALLDHGVVDLAGS